MISVINLLMLSYVTFSQSIVLLSDSNTQAVELLFAWLENFCAVFLLVSYGEKVGILLGIFLKMQWPIIPCGLVSGIHGLPFQS